MNTLTPISHPGLTAQSGLDQLSRGEPKDLEQQKTQLRKATKQFESLFMYQMLQAMRKTAKASSLAEGGAFSDSFGKDTFMEMFDMHLAEKMSGQKRSIAEMLYESLVKNFDTGTEAAGTKHEIQALPTDRHEAIPMRRETIEIDSRPARPIIPVKVRSLRSMKAASPVKTHGQDSIVGRYGDLIDEAAAVNKIDSALICAVIKTESGGDPRAESPAGAKGLMQLMDDTAAELGVTKVFDPRQNILSGARYLARQMDRFGDPRLALAAYNAGPGNVARYQGIPPFPETEEYVQRVMQAYASYQEQLTDNDPKAASHSGR